MSITEISVKRPAAITMVIALLIGLGVFGYRSMGADLLPSMNIPIITISDTYNGASADDVKQDIVKPIEDAVSGISGIDTLSSRSREGVGSVIIRFNMGVNMNSALMDVQKAVDNVQGKLPNDAGKPVIYKVDTDDQPIMTLALSGNASYDELYNQANKMQTDLQKVLGVAQVSLEGSEKKQLIIKLDKTAVEYYGLNITSVLNKLKNDNVSMPAGQIKQDKSNESIRVMGEFQNIDEVKNILIPISNGGGTVRLGDIADVKLDYPDPTTETKLNGKKTIALTIQKQSDSNVVEVVNSIKDEMNVIKRTMPKSMNIIVANDSTVFINQSLSQIKHSLIEGIITTAIVLLFFLKSWRSSLVVLIAIPTSLISTFFMMYEFNFTLNMMSLMGLSLCIGILVDDSIVVLENIQRHLSLGKNPIRAAIEGRKEIGMAAVAITLCDVVVFAPVAFMSGITGQYFKQFGLTIVFATLFSLFVSFTVTPMLASRFFDKKVEGKEGFLSKHRDNMIVKAFAKVNKFMADLTESYKRFLIWSLNNRAKVLIVVSICVVLSIALIPLGFIGSEFISQSDQSTFSISMSLTPGSTLKQTDEKLAQVEKYLNGIKEVKYYFTEVGSNNDTSSAKITVTLVPKAERKRSQSVIASQVRTMGRKIPGIDFQVSESQMGGGGGSNKPVTINISGDDQDTLKDLSLKVQDIVGSVSGVTDVSNSLDSSTGELRVKIDRLAASEYGVSISDVSSALRTAIQGSSAGTYRGDNDEYDITLKFMDGQVKSAADVGAIMIQSSSGQSVPLNEVASIQEASSPKSISRQNREDVVTVSANINGRPLGTVTQDIRNKLAAMTVPLGYRVSYGGNQKQMADSFTALAQALTISIVLVYMVLVVLYESFLTPLVRMLALPCAVIGALGILALTGNTLNMMSIIGLIMLDGLASKNGTLLIDYTNTLMKTGMNLKEALIAAGTTRLRPIIMTSVTMIVGMLPSALAVGEGSETRSGMSWVIIGGMIASTILSPIILPVVYTLMDDFKNWIFKGRKKKSYVTEVD